MDALTLYTELNNRGIALAVTGEKLTYQAAMGVLTPDLLAGIKQHKAALMEWARVGQGRQGQEQPTEPGQIDTTESYQEQPTTEGRPWYRPTDKQLETWRAFYGGCSWYVNPFGDNPIGPALEYITDNRAAACCALFSTELINYYAACQARTITTEPGQEQPTEPREFTALLRAAWQEKNRARVLALAGNFRLTESRQAELNEILAAWPGAPVNVMSAASVSSKQEKEPVSSSNVLTGQDTPDINELAATTEPGAADSARKQFGTLFVDIRAGQGITESGTRFSFPANCSLSEFIFHAAATGPVNRVYICGEHPGDGTSSESYINWLMDGGMMESYTTSKIGHYFDFKKPDMSVARYQARAGRGSLDIRRINSWLGDDRDSNDTRLYTIEDARAALLLVTRVLRQHFPLFRNLSGTPSTTFKHLWTQGNHVAKKQFPPLSDDIRALIHQNAGQGRIEYFPDNCKGRAPGLFYYDGIFMYAALTGELPTEVAAHDTEPVYAGYTPARYRIKYRVPADWQHIGLFMTKRDGADWRDKDGWWYPGAGQAGQEFETWVDGAELHVALNLPAGMPRWDITILERILFKPWKESRVNKPLETITRKMIEIRAALDNDKRQDSKHAPIYDLARGAVRNILLHGIGSFNRENKVKTYLLMPGEQPPVQLTRKAEYNVLDDGRQVINVPEDAAPDEMMHPEFSAAVWARARARVTKAALSVDYSELVTIRTDAIAVKSRQEHLETGEKPGQFRRKWAVEKPLVCPANHEKFDELQHKVLGK